MRVPLIHALPWHIAGSVLMRVRQSIRSVSSPSREGQGSRPLTGSKTQMTEYIAVLIGALGAENLSRFEYPCMPISASERTFFERLRPDGRAALAAGDHPGRDGRSPWPSPSRPSTPMRSAGVVSRSRRSRPSRVRSGCPWKNCSGRIGRSRQKARPGAKAAAAGGAHPAPAARPAALRHAGHRYRPRQHSAG